MKTIFIFIWLTYFTTMFPDPVNNNPVHLSYERREAVVVRMIADHVKQLENETFINEQDHQWLYVIDLGWR